MKKFGVVVRPKLSPGCIGTWINIYWRDKRPRAGGAYPTRREADVIAKPYRHSCIFVSVPKEGERP